jgi:hypothetical protein
MSLEVVSSPVSQIPADALCESWESIHEKTLQLGQLIEQSCRQNDESFDRMVVVPRGSYYPANILSREFNFPADALVHACIGSYATGASSREQTFELGQMPTRDQIEGQRLLVIDEVCDTGHTLRFLNDFLLNFGAAAVKTGVLHYKPTKNETGFVPDWYVEKTDKWIVYPWELHEENGETSVVNSKNHDTREGLHGHKTN